MNTLLLSAGVLGLFTTALHIFGGQITLIRPFLKAELEDDVKGCLLVCWHLVSAYLLLSSSLFVFTALNEQPSLQLLIDVIAGFYVLFAALFILVGWSIFGVRVVYKLPQRTLLLPIGILALAGARAA